MVPQALRRDNVGCVLTYGATTIAALEEDIMLFMVTSRPKDGTTRRQLIEHLTRKLDPSTWDLIRYGVVSDALYKVGEEPGFFAVLNASGIEDARALVDSGAERLEVFVT